MSDNRVSTIVKEIKYWKEHKLLPETYCDFLLALYTNGDGELSGTSKKNKVMVLLPAILCIMLLPFSFLVIYFTKFEAVLQLTILILFFSYSFWCSIYLKKHTTYLYHMALVISLLLLLMFTVFIGNLWNGHSYLIAGIILLNFIFWLFLSNRQHLHYLKFTGVIGLVFSIIYIIL
ncbi:hypothetical protein [Oceanobacillus salinisoli]|uniref:hypothetical protein n=1 Tax=Oceanobacillus salinisoli TaxID=2678611 RepID=UPI0012E307E2|nr:hypothetical protein [Oceanobacillus salinisoli]